MFQPDSASAAIVYISGLNNTACQLQRDVIKDQQVELRQLKAELKRVTEERDVQKKAAAYFVKESG